MSSPLHETTQGEPLQGFGVNGDRIPEKEQKDCFYWQRKFNRIEKYKVPSFSRVCPYVPIPTIKVPIFPSRLQIQIVLKFSHLHDLSYRNFSTATVGDKSFFQSSHRYKFWCSKVECCHAKNLKFESSFGTRHGSLRRVLKKF